MKIFDIDGREQGLDGDATTTGAICHASLEQTSLDDGRMALRLGDKTSPCGVCGQVGKIVEGDHSFKWDGIPTAVHKALVLCTCPPGTNRLIAARSGSSRAGRAVTSPAAAPGEAVPMSRGSASPLTLDVQSSGRTFARTFVILDSETGQPLPNRTYTATVDGQQITGKTDSNGLVRIEGSSAHSIISLHVMFRSPARELNELAGMKTRQVTTAIGVERMIHGETQSPIVVTLNDRAATRESNIREVREMGLGFVERSEWHAKPPKKPLDRDWDYTMIALHHAGRSYSCGAGADQMQEAQQTHFTEKKFDDIGYHFGIDCSGIVYEGRDIRFKASGVELYNTGVISIVLLNNLTTPEEGGDYTAWGRSVLDAIGFSTTNSIPLQQANATLDFVIALKSAFNITQLGGHKEFPGQKANGKICPGNIGINLVNLSRTRTSLERPPKA